MLFIPILLTECVFAEDAKTEAEKPAVDILSLSLEELLKLKVSIATNLSADEYETPASSSMITEQQIRLSGARTLNELLSIFVPGYFLVEDQDDTIASFRGLVPDNNSKTLLLIDGVSVNADWFWGVPDSVLNGLDMDYIERIEVIRGPGSVTLGQGALIGVINIITKDYHIVEPNLRLTLGENGLQKFSVSQKLTNDYFFGQIYLSKGQFDSEPVRNEGWARFRIDQGLSVFERNHHLKRAEYQNALIDLKLSKWSVALQHFEHSRDLYNFYRDREVVTQRLNNVVVNRPFEFSENAVFNFTSHFSRDDYQLQSHGRNIETSDRFVYESETSAFSSVANTTPYSPDSIVEANQILGGTREERLGLKGVFNLRSHSNQNNLAVGVEWQTINMGKQNFSNDNFIVNEVVQLAGINRVNGVLVTGESLNIVNAWAKPASVTIKSLFVEDQYRLNESWSIFGAFRYDDHSDWGAQVTPRFGAFYRPNDTQIYRISVQSGFRGAVGVQFGGGFVQDGFLAQSNFEELNLIADTIADFDFDGVGSNDSGQLVEVEPEKLKSLELSAKIDWSAYSFDGTYFYNVVTDVLSASANGYEGLSYGDLIGTDIVGTWNGNWYYQNQAGELKQQGLELSVRTKINNIDVGFSHSLVNIVDSDTDLSGAYVLESGKPLAYPENITRMQLDYTAESEVGQWQVHYNHVHYWDYFSPDGSKVSGTDVGNLSVVWVPNTQNYPWEIMATIKNIWNSESLYPIKSTGSIEGTLGAPSLESRTFWLGATYRFQ